MGTIAGTYSSALEGKMSEPTAPSGSEPIIDIRALSPQQGFRQVLEAYSALNVEASLVVLADNELMDLRESLERELAVAFDWETLASDDELFRVRITRRSSTALPRVVLDTSDLLASSSQDAAGSIWRLEPGARDLDSNIIALPPQGEIGQHVGPELDVLIFVLTGSGELHTELDTIALQSGHVLWLPAKAQRRFTAGPEGLRYLTVHQRKPTLNISAPPQR